MRGGRVARCQGQRLGPGLGPSGPQQGAPPPLESPLRGGGLGPRGPASPAVGPPPPPPRPPPGQRGESPAASQRPPRCLGHPSPPHTATMAEQESLEFGKADFVLLDTVTMPEFMANLRLR